MGVAESAIQQTLALGEAGAPVGSILGEQVEGFILMYGPEMAMVRLGKLIPEMSIAGKVAELNEVIGQK